MALGVDNCSVVFSSYLFIFYFLPVAIGVYYIMPRRGKHLTLALFSYLFYGWANPWFIFLIFASTLVDYVCGRVMTRSTDGLIKEGGATRTQKYALMASIVSNLSLLGFFKYFNFGMESWNSLLGAMGMGSGQYHDFLRITLPLGISFYTFQSMSYTIDIYRGRGRAITNFVDFALWRVRSFVSMKLTSN